MVQEWGATGRVVSDMSLCPYRHYAYRWSRKSSFRGDSRFTRRLFLVLPTYNIWARFIDISTSDVPFLNRLLEISVATLIMKQPLIFAFPEYGRKSRDLMVVVDVSVCLHVYVVSLVCVSLYNLFILKGPLYLPCRAWIPQWKRKRTRAFGWMDGTEEKISLPLSLSLAN